MCSPWKKFGECEEETTCPLDVYKRMHYASVVSHRPEDEKVEEEEEEDFDVPFNSRVVLPSGILATLT